MRPWVWILIVIAVIGGGGAWAISAALNFMFTESQNVDQAAQHFSNDLVASGWTIAAFSKNATPDYLASLQRDGTAAFDKYGGLGAPRSLDQCSVVRIDITNGVGHARASCAIVFDKGKAILQLSLFDPGGDGWKIDGLAVQL